MSVERVEYDFSSKAFLAARFSKVEAVRQAVFEACSVGSPLIVAK